MDIRRTWYIIKKKVRKRYKKIKKWFKRYIRLLVRHTKAKDYSVLMYTIFAVIAFILVIVLFGKLFSAIGGRKDSKKDKKPEQTTATPADATEDPAVEAQNQLIGQCQIIYENNRDLLILVNASHPLAENYTFTHHTLNCGYDVDERAYQDLANMLSDLNAQDLHYDIISAYRSRETQQSILDNEIQNLMNQGMTEEEARSKALETIQPAGYSEHETGLALDISPEGVYTLSESIANDPSNQWLVQNCYKYGFILRYPAGKEASTGIACEPWHFRYVGIEAAAFLHNNNLTLEEFHELLGN